MPNKKKENLTDNSLNIQTIAIIVFLVFIGLGLLFLFFYTDKFSDFQKIL